MATTTSGTSERARSAEHNLPAGVLRRATRPYLPEAGLSLADVKRTVFELHTLVAGDLTGAPQPA